MRLREATSCSYCKGSSVHVQPVSGSPPFLWSRVKIPGWDSLTKKGQSAIIWLKMPHPFVRNTLLSSPCFERIAALPAPEEVCPTLVDIVTRFQQMKAFA